MSTSPNSDALQKAMTAYKNGFANYEKRLEGLAEFSETATAASLKSLNHY